MKKLKDVLLFLALLAIGLVALAAVFLFLLHIYPDTTHGHGYWRIDIPLRTQR